jgi:PhnB protein
MKTATTYLHFDGNCRQAMTFYQQCFGSQLQLHAYPGANGQASTEPDARIMHAQLFHGGPPFLMASDGPPGGSEMKPGTNFSVAVECDSLEEIERLFAAISQKGKVRMPLSDVPWGARFGMLTDQFGIQWMLNFTLPPQKS